MTEEEINKFSFSGLSDAELEVYRNFALRSFHYYDAEIERRKQKPITPEEREKSLEQCRSIAKNVEVKA